MSKRICIIHPEGNINNNPCLTAIVQNLCESGWLIDVFCHARDEISQLNPCEGCRVMRTKNEGVEPLGAMVVFPAHPTIEESVRAFKDWVKSQLGQYDLVIGVDQGIIEAEILARIWEVPYGLISFEIRFTDEMGVAKSAEKRREQEACRNVSFAVCQGYARSALLSLENRIPRTKIIDIPVAGRIAGNGERSLILHEMLGLPHTQRILLYIGEIAAEWSGVGAAVTSMAHAPSNWTLVLHHRYGMQHGIKTLQALSANALPNVTVSPFEPLPLSELHRLIACADMGLGLYIPTPGSITDGRNLEFIGMASGKLATYVQYGVPVIVNEIGEWSDHVRSQGLGIVVKSAGEVGSLLRELGSRDLAADRARCLKFFSENLDVDRTIQPLKRRLEECLAE